MIVFAFCGFLQSGFSQDTLPSFTVKNRFGRVIISWVNPFDSLVQVSIQRSPDSLRGFKTIATLPDPTAVTNGYLDSKAPNTRQFYKLYVQQPRGQFFITQSIRPVVDSTRLSSSAPSKTGTGKMSKEDSTLSIRYELAGTTPSQTKYINGRKVTDSSRIDVQEIRTAYKPSVFIYTNKEGNVVVALPEAKANVFSIKFFRENGAPVFQLNRVKEPMLILDKSNFLHAGWFEFELYENEVLKEKQRLYVPKDRQ